MALDTGYGAAPPDWPIGKFGAIMADPPWTFRLRGKDNLKKSAAKHFGLMSFNDILRLPVRDIAADDCVLFLWTPDAHLGQAFQVIEDWGFTYKTMGFYWVKTTRLGRFFFGMGFWTRQNPEMCLLATRGRPRRLSAAIPSLIVAQRREYARKPEEARERIERLVAGPYCELFGRQQRPGWTVWGNEADKFDVAA